eukprot:GHVT01007874.1.p1 GENE.GHVT01007874.1~~GHVT01007874.1.p1  ORF type:complete len:189 (+),score=47.47 GHVT01007874.1:457-1023(+)
MAQVPWEILKERQLEGGEVTRRLASLVKASTKALRGASSAVLHSLQQLQALVAGLDGRPDTAQIWEANVMGTVQLLPCQLGIQECGARLFLMHFTLRYVPELCGIWLGYRRLRLADGAAFIPEAEPRGVLVFQVMLDVLLFKPAKGALLCKPRASALRHQTGKGLQTTAQLPRRNEQKAATFFPTLHA